MYWDQCYCSEIIGKLIVGSVTTLEVGALASQAAGLNGVGTAGVYQQ